jgi:hypothetical protein
VPVHVQGDLGAGRYNDMFLRRVEGLCASALVLLQVQVRCAADSGQVPCGANRVRGGVDRLGLLVQGTCMHLGFTWVQVTEFSEDFSH